MDKEQLTQLAKKLVTSSGAFAAGIATTETLKGGPPSTDLTYVLPEARVGCGLCRSSGSGGH